MSRTLDSSAAAKDFAVPAVHGLQVSVDPGTLCGERGVPGPAEEVSPVLLPLFTLILLQHGGLQLTSKTISCVEKL